MKNVDTELKIISLNCLWICRLYNEVDHDWEIIYLNYIHNTLGKNFTFHSNLSIPNKTLIPLPLFYKDIIKSWCSSFFVLQMFLLLFLHSAYGTIHIWKLIKKLFFIKNFLTKNLTMLVICLAISTKLSLGKK